MGTITTTAIANLNNSNSYTENGSSTITTIDIECKFTENDEAKSVTWDPNTIDNEHMNKKSSKCCCIFTGKKGHNCDSSSDDEGCEKTERNSKEK
ncbi:protein phosphatase inhibitor domain-containing protein [Theileria equi strain WA]|uniref:Protein phosphatase inhibitor domain-containing protein n=1 Tax=Theileria equi strain WA TaxID=1537102 RepID=L0B2Z0_THEEQ|nr:protein phosphatase inhibitor domain-containing protein [Theileria equi strain WA]AFZ81591.1 protein phosphatase inhibitor domain-containing protein [Theileria equi strain WA]|eukprot:XP_004831257.1 protein phosphatase inhibitor domain-containing protein [Theileria equi strain WA]